MPHTAETPIIRDADWESGVPATRISPSAFDGTRNTISVMGFPHRRWYVFPAWKHGQLKAMVIGHTHSSKAGAYMAFKNPPIFKEEASTSSALFGWESSAQPGPVATTDYTSIASDLRELTAAIKQRQWLAFSSQLRSLARTALEGLAGREQEDVKDWSRRLVRDVVRADD